MIIDNKTVHDIAHLSRLDVSENETTILAGEMSKILDWMEKLNEVDTSNIKPLIHMSAELNVLREDETGNILEHEAALLNAPHRDSNYFRVPKVIE